MIEKKLIETLQSLGFRDIDLGDRIISRRGEGNEMILISKDILLTNIEYPAGEERPAHTHPELRITFIRSGRAHVTLHESQTELLPGDISVILPGVEHSLTAGGEEPLRICELVISKK